MVLDHIEKLSFNSEEEDYLFDAQMTLANLSQGLFWIYNSVKKAELKIRDNAIRENNLVDLLCEQRSDISYSWLSCGFQWYAVSVCNYIRLTGWLTLHDIGKAKNYSEQLIPKVIQYRNKVAAHFAIFNPRKDNKADQIASIMTKVIYANGYLRAGAIGEVITTEGGQKIRPQNKTSWSLTKIHEKLSPRYWPQGPLEAYPVIKISAGKSRELIINTED